MLDLEAVETVVDTTVVYEHLNEKKKQKKLFSFALSDFYYKLISKLYSIDKFAQHILIFQN